MRESNFTVRVLRREDEIAQFVRLVNAVFAPDGDQEKGFASFRHYLANSPDVRAESVRGAFDPVSGRLLGGYLLLQRNLCIGPARLATGCIGAVAVAPNERKRGVASALMYDASVYAEMNKLALLFLTGIPNFYHRLAYVPVLEENELYLERDAIQALPPVEDIQVRDATAADANTLLALYQRHFHPYIGSFDRTLAEQAYLLQREGAHYLLACTSDGQVVGYLQLRQSDRSLSQKEIAASDWQVIAALLQEQERRLAAQESDSQTAHSAPKPAHNPHLIWNVPPDSQIFYHLAEHVPFRSQSLHHYSADWMARIGNLDALVQALIPLWNQRLLNTPLEWSGMPGILNLGIGERHFPLHISPDGVRMTGDLSLTYDEDGANALLLTQKAFIQLTFGFRPVAWFAHQPEQHIPPALLPLLDVLFPLAPSWVAGSDYF
ncbi:MAG: GNAT family N-acetyltransferase [Ardenticatenaceae bacterium]